MVNDQSRNSSFNNDAQNTSNIIEFIPPGIDPTAFDQSEFEPVATTVDKEKPPTIDPALFKPKLDSDFEEFDSPPPLTSGDSEVPVYEEVHKNVVAIGGDISEISTGPDLESMSFEERVNHLREVVFKNPLEREIHYKTLKFCFERRTLQEIEEFIGSLPEFSAAAQSQYYLLQFLLRGAGIEEYEVDAYGKTVRPEQKEGLTEDEIDDLVVTLAYETNEYGRELVEQISPKNRILETLEIMPNHYDTFVEVLDFLTEKRSLSQVDSLLRGRDVLMVGRAPSDRPLQPSVFVDKLEKAAAIYWEKGWIISDEGREILEILKERRG